LAHWVPFPEPGPLQNIKNDDHTQGQRILGALLQPF